MFYVEYTENDERKALNLAMCKKIETYSYQTGTQSTFCIKVHHDKYQNAVTITCKSKDELLDTFDSLMNAVKECQAHWKVPDPFPVSDGN